MKAKLMNHEGVLNFMNKKLIAFGRMYNEINQK